jgi:ABC transporter
VLGANGAGKTSLLNAIAGIVRPAGGSIGFNGAELVGLSPHRIVELGIATVPENRHLFGPGKVLPDAASTSLPSISRRLRWPTNCLAGGLSRLSSAMVSMFPPRWLKRYFRSEIALATLLPARERVSSLALTLSAICSSRRQRRVRR